MDTYGVTLIPLSKGLFATVCDCHYDLVKDYKWHAVSGKYAARTLWPSRKMEYLHRVIAGTPKNKGTDHIDGDSLNNTCRNLRITDHQRYNVYNQRRNSRSTTGYKGVSFVSRNNKYRAYIVKNRKQIWLGYHNTAKEAALAYNKAAIELWGEYARLNIVKR